jgi:hypothetical protein
LSCKHDVRVAVKEAISARLGGFAGLVDRDFEDISPDTIVPRLAFISRRYNDLEACMLASTAGELMKDLVRRDAKSDIPWLSSDCFQTPAQLLVEWPVSVVGAIRKAWVGRTTKLDRNGYCIDSMIDLLAPCQEPTIEQVSKALSAAAGLGSSESDRIAADALRMRKRSEPWALVRGKDLVRAIAYVLSRAGDACYYPFGQDGAPKAVEIFQRKIQERVVTLFDIEALRAAGTEEALRAALTTTDEPPDRYLCFGHAS